MTSIRAVLAACALALVAPAFAQSPPPPTPGEVRQGVIETCGPQMNQFCGNVQAGHGRLVRCLKSHFSQLNPQCKGHLAEAYAIREEEQP